MLKNKWSDLYGNGVAPVVIDNAGGYRDLITGAAGAGKPDIDRSMAGELIAVRPGLTADAPLLFSDEKGGSTSETANDSIYVIVFIPDIIGQADPSIKIPLQGLAASSDGGDFLIPGAMLYVVNAPGQGWLIHYRMVNTLADDAGDNQEKIDGAEFLALSDTQAPFDLDTVDVDAINAIATRQTKNGQQNYVAPLGNTGLLFFAPPKAQLKVKGEEMIFTPETLNNQAVFFVPDPDFKDPTDGNPVQIHGVAIQCSGYFRLIVPDAAVKGEPFSAIELDSGHNTGVVGSGRVYPPGGYIFHLDGSAPVGIDMMDRYDLGGDVILSQPAGYKAMYVELYRTAVPELYMALYSGQNAQIVNLDNNSVAPATDVGSFQSQELLTTDRLRTILINLMSAASKDPTGEGYAYLPWKYERWYKKEGKAPDWNLGSTDVATLNAAKRSKNLVTGRELFAGTFVTAPRNSLLSPNLSLYAEQDVALFNGSNADGTPTVGIRIETSSPKTKTITVLSGRGTLFGVVDIYLKANTPFSFRFTNQQDPDQTIGLKVVRAYDPTEKNTLLLIDGENYSIEDSIFPVGEYIFRSYESAGFVLSVLSATNLTARGAITMPGAAVEITRLRQTSGRDYYNAWFETAGVPKIVNSVDAKDQPKTLDGFIQSEPAELEDIKALESLLGKKIEELQTAIDSTAIWKIEEWIGYSDPSRPFTIMPATSGKTADLGNGVTANASTAGDSKFQVVDYGLIYRDPDLTTSSKMFYIKQTTLPYLDQVTVSATRSFKLSFAMSDGDPDHIGVPVAYDADADKGMAVFDAKGNLLTVADLTNPLAAAEYLIQMGRQVNIVINYTPAQPADTAFVFNVKNPRTRGTPLPFSVVYTMDGKIKSIVNMNDVTDRRDDLEGMRRVPKPIDVEIENELLGRDGKPITVDQLHDDLRDQIESMERSAGYWDMGTKSGELAIDWSTDKYNRAITLGGNLKITMLKPPPSPQFLEIMIQNPTGSDYKLTSVIAPQPMAKPIGEQKIDKSAPLWIKLFWDGKQYYTDVEDL